MFADPGECRNGHCAVEATGKASLLIERGRRERDHAGAIRQIQRANRQLIAILFAAVHESVHGTNATYGPR
jgi:hypothetical protein